MSDHQAPPADLREQVAERLALQLTADMFGTRAHTSAERAAGRRAAVLQLLAVAERERLLRARILELPSEAEGFDDSVLLSDVLAVFDEILGSEGNHEEDADTGGTGGARRAGGS